ncbi:MAG: hypothetical protein H7308_00705 [Chthonomonadaceae bacterium]|nr:hypothetical protein [Chthonomonadaceae bacterium]
MESDDIEICCPSSHRARQDAFTEGAYTVGSINTIDQSHNRLKLIKLSPPPKTTNPNPPLASGEGAE